jgi:hypothetical protein
MLLSGCSSVLFSPTYVAQSGPFGVGLLSLISGSGVIVIAYLRTRNLDAGQDGSGMTTRWIKAQKGVDGGMNERTKGRIAKVGDVGFSTTVQNEQADGRFSFPIFFSFSFSSFPFPHA